MVTPTSWHPATAHDAAMVGYTSRTKLTVPGGTSTVPESAGCAPPDEQAPAANAANKMTNALCLASSRATATSSKREAYHRRRHDVLRSLAHSVAERSAALMTSSVLEDVRRREPREVRGGEHVVGDVDQEADEAVLHLLGREMFGGEADRQQGGGVLAPVGQVEGNVQGVVGE